MEEIIISQLIAKYAAEYPWITAILSAFGGLMVLAQIIVPLTPTKKDDEILAWIQRGFRGKVLRAFLSFAPIQKKDGNGKA